MNFKDLQNSNSNMKDLFAELKKSETKQSYKDSRFWKLGRDEKSGVGQAIIRFLPTTEEGKPAWVKLFTHSFKGPGGWYIENSRTTLGEDDPVSEMNSELWATNIEANRELARTRKRKLSYISNIYVVKDPKNPENEGKVFLFKYGVKIFDMIKGVMQPEFEGEEPFNPFCMWSGSNFRIKTKNIASYPNYDQSSFDSSAVLLDNDEELEKIWKSEYDLSEFTNEANFKSYDELKAKMKKVLGLNKKPVSNFEDAVTGSTVITSRVTPDDPPVNLEDYSTDSEDEDLMNTLKNLAVED